MKCKQCGKEFTELVIERLDDYDRGDGVMYGSVSYSNRPICPFCGHDNGMVARIKS